MRKETAARPIFRDSRLPPKTFFDEYTRHKNIRQQMREKQKELECERKKTTRIKWSEMKWNESKTQSKKAKKTQQEQQEKQWQLKGKKEGGQKKKETNGVLRSECRENRTCCCCCCPRAYIPVLAGSWISAGSGQVIRLSSGLVWSGQVRSGYKAKF